MGQVRIGWLLFGAAAALFAGVLVWRGLLAPAGDTATIGVAPSGAVRTPEDATRERPTDPEAWKTLGLARFDAQDFAAATAAFERATTLAPDRADLWSALGEARVMDSARDPMPAPALAAFRKAIALDPRDPRSRYFLAVQRDLSGDHQGAIDDWFALLRDTPPGAPWEQDLRRTIAQVGKINGIDVTAKLGAITAPVPPQAGPDAAQLRAAAALPPSEQAAMAQAMVARLEAKLKADPANVDGWIMLMRSRITLGEPSKASAALAAGIAANPGVAARLRAEAEGLGVPAR